MSNILFSVFPSENFIDLGLYQFGWEKCDPGHSFGPAARNHYLFHYIISGTGTLMADNAAGVTQTYQIRSGQGLLIFPGQINTYIADASIPWEYVWLEFDGLRVKESVDLTTLSPDDPVYRSHSKDKREFMMNEMLYIAHHAKESPLHLIGHLYLFLDYFLESCRSTQLVSSGRMSDFYIKEAISFIEQNFQNHITVEDIAAFCGIDRSYFGKVFHRAVGKSPQEFLISYRMAKAAELLRMTSLSIADVGNAVGYENQLHFSRAFKSVYGISPKNWRAQHKL